MMIDREKLVKEALKVRESAYSPYSNFCVGAALLSADGEIFTGANVENSSYGGTICAERSAFCSAISKGKRTFLAIAIVGAHRGDVVTELCAPCGICRQFMAEFCSPDFEILLYDGKNVKAYALSELLPAAFNKDNLNK